MYYSMNEKQFMVLMSNLHFHFISCASTILIIPRV
jgi:hypothetical protein